MSELVCRERLRRVGPGRHPGPMCGRRATVVVVQDRPEGVRFPMCGLHARPYRAQVAALPHCGWRLEEIE